MSLPPSTYLIKDEEYKALTKKANFIQWLIYAPYNVFTNTFIGILYGLLIISPIFWLIFFDQDKILRLILIFCSYFYICFSSGIYIFSENQFDALKIWLLFIISLATFVVILPSEFQVYDGIVQSLPILLGLVVVASFALYVLWIFFIKRITKHTSTLSQMELNQPFGDGDGLNYKDLPQSLPIYFDDLGKVFKKRSSSNPYRQFYVKSSAALAGCLVIFYLPLIAFYAVFDSIGKLNTRLQIWGLRNILLLTGAKLSKSKENEKSAST